MIQIIRCSIEYFRKRGVEDGIEIFKELAEVMECKSIAFPLLASGNNGFDLELALKIALKSIEAYEPKCLELVTLVIFGNRISEIVKNAGFEVTILPRNFEAEKEQLEARKKMINGVKGVAQQFMEAQIQKGIEYLKDPENREAAVQFGIKIVKMVMKK